MKAFETSQVASDLFLFTFYTNIRDIGWGEVNTNVIISQPHKPQFSNMVSK